jgi:hypothetical protein
MREARRARATEELFDVRPRAGYAFWTLDVRNPLRKTRYRVLVPSYPSADGAMCSCTDFATRGLGTCKHIEAARLWLDERRASGEISLRPVAPIDGAERVDAVWTAIDRGLEARRADRSPASARLRAPGSALYRDGDR